VCSNFLVDGGVACGLFAVGQSQVRHKLVAMTILIAGAEARAQGLQLFVSLLDAEPGYWAIRRGKLIEACAGNGEGFDCCGGLSDTFGERGGIAATTQRGVEKRDVSRARILHSDIVVIDIVCD
jgi:hypothetical protein